MKQYMEFVDDVLYEFDGQLSFSDIKNMTYKEKVKTKIHVLE